MERAVDRFSLVEILFKRSTNIYFVILYLAIKSKSEYASIGLSRSLKTLWRRKLFSMISISISSKISAEAM